MSTTERATWKSSGICCPAAEKSKHGPALSSREDSIGLDFQSETFSDTCTNAQKPMRIIGFSVPNRLGHESPTSVLLQGGDQTDTSGSERHVLTMPKSFLAEELKRHPAGRVDVFGGQLDVQKRLPKLKLQKNRRKCSE